MERGLLWLPLLVLFVWLASSGKKEYQKLEAYKLWAEDFDNAKYDIYAVLGKQGRELTWGKPTSKGIVDLDTFSFADVQTINLLVNDVSVDPDNPPAKGKAHLEFILGDRQNSPRIPFTDLELAVKWYRYLYQEWKNS